METFSLDVAHFQVDSPVPEAKGSDIAIAIKRNVAGVRRHEGVDGHSVESAVDLGRNITQNNQVCHFALNATRLVRPVKVFGSGPFGLEACTILLTWCSFVLRAKTAWGHDRRGIVLRMCWRFEISVRYLSMEGPSCELTFMYNMGPHHLQH